MMQYANILENEHFNDLAAIVRLPFHAPKERPINFWPLVNKFNAVTPTDGAWNRAEVVAAFTDLMTSLVETGASYTESDLTWFISLLDESPKVYRPIIKLLQAWYSAPEA